MAFEDRMILNSKGDKFERVYFDPEKDENLSGWEALGDRVLVRCDIMRARSEGGIILPEETQAINQLSAETGVIVDAGAAAFVWNADRMREFGGVKPVPGTRVYFDRYAGVMIMGLDKEMYRMMDDKHIAAREKPRGKTRSQEQ